jgi:DNA polymerase-1
VDVLDDRDLTEWPRTANGKLTTRRQQLQLNADLPAINELLKVRALRKMIEAFGESLISAINPATGRLHTSFMIAGASTGRFSARGPNLQQMPKSKQKGFRKIFAAPAGQLVLALVIRRSSFAPWLKSSAIGPVKTAFCASPSPQVWMPTPPLRWR